MPILSLLAISCPERYSAVIGCTERVRLLAAIITVLFQAGASPHARCVLLARESPRFSWDQGNNLQSHIVGQRVAWYIAQNNLEMWQRDER
jgi:hypothetical protein